MGLRETDMVQAHRCEQGAQTRGMGRTHLSVHPVTLANGPEAAGVHSGATAGQGGLYHRARMGVDGVTQSLFAHHSPGCPDPEQTEEMEENSSCKQDGVGTGDRD